MCEGKIAKIIVHIITVAIWLCGILLIVFGSIALSDPNSAVNMLTVAEGTNNLATIIDINPLIEGVAIFMIVLGCLLFVFGGLGCHGVGTGAKITLMLFWLTLIGAILVEVALIIYASVYPGSMENYVQEQMEESLKVNFKQGNVTVDVVNLPTDEKAAAWERLQYQTHCCGAGIGGHNDYAKFNLTDFHYAIRTDRYDTAKIPLSCCITKLKEGEIPAKADNATFENYSTCLSSTPDSYWGESCWIGVKNMMYNFNYISIILCASLIAA
jgi:predicted membrane channel-forming protein YqfA (hemolysin III family)